MPDDHYDMLSSQTDGKMTSSEILRGVCRAVTDGIFVPPQIAPWRNAYRQYAKLRLRYVMQKDASTHSTARHIKRNAE